MKVLGLWVMIIIFSLIGDVWSANQVALAQHQDERIVVRKSDLSPELLKKYEVMAIQEQMGKYSEYVQLGKAAGVAVREGSYNL